MTAYLIAHVVRGLPAFDIAERMECPLCHPGYDMPTEGYCEECNNEGHWWIIPTSGHRAHPYWSADLQPLLDDLPVTYNIPEPPTNWPDHYPLRTAKAQADPNATHGLLASLGLLKPSEPLKRRI